MPFHVTLDRLPVTVYTNVRPLRWMGKLGLCIGARIWLAPPQAGVWPALLAHEFCHVLQWRHYGAWGFLWRYVAGIVTHGYRKHPMEREAYDFAVARGQEPQFAVLTP
jgi:hypothetical protein